MTSREPLTIPLAAYRADPLRYERMVTPERPLRVVDEDGGVYSTSSVDASEPCNFCAPLDLDGPPQRAPLSVPFIVFVAAFLVGFLLAVSVAS